MYFMKGPGFKVLPGQDVILCLHVDTSSLIDQDELVYMAFCVMAYYED